MTGFVDQFLHIRRNRALEANFFTGYGMDEAQHRSMQCLAGEAEPLEQRPEVGLGASINRVSQ